MARRMSPTNAQSYTQHLVSLYNMGLVSRRHLMKHYNLDEAASSKAFWRRHRRTEDEAAATLRMRLFGA